MSEEYNLERYQKIWDKEIITMEENYFLQEDHDNGVFVDSKEFTIDGSTYSAVVMSSLGIKSYEITILVVKEDE